MVNGKKRGVFLLLILISNGLWGAKNPCITDIFFHKKTGIEVGALAFYFSDQVTCPQPDVKPMTAKKMNGAQEVMFQLTLPKLTVASSQVLQRITAINATNSPLFKIKVDPSSKQGLHIAIIFDPAAIDIRYDKYNSIKLQPGIVITLYNKKLVKELEQHVAKPILHTAHAPMPKNIVIDCGHGGSDDGAHGLFDLKEKNVTLAVGKELAHLLKKNGYQVVLTRAGDEFVALDQRTSLANAHQALLISLHANYAANTQAQGIETFYLPKTEVNHIFSTYDTTTARIIAHVETSRSRASLQLATAIHNQVLGAARAQDITLGDRTVKHALSQIMLGASQPAVLIEMGFLSNQHDASLLKQHTYKQLLAQGVYKGIEAFFSSSHAAVL